jgi:CheY-like chemotaxis protein
MATSEEYQWVKSTANELNNLLQVITESSQMLETLCEGTRDTDRYFAMMRSAVERAANVTQVMIDRAGGASVQSDVQSSAQALHVVERQQPAAPAKTDIKIFNPQGPLELIMLVDDEEFVTMLAERVLADEGYRVITTKDGMEAIDVYRKIGNEIDLILLDFTMPIMDGADVFDELLQMNPRVPVVLSSGFTEKDNLRGMLAKGLRGFIPKPYTQQKLLTEVRAALNAIKEEKTGVRPLL